MTTGVVSRAPSDVLKEEVSALSHWLRAAGERRRDEKAQVAARRSTDGEAMLGTLIRAGDVLELITLEEPEWGVTAAAQRLGIGKSLAHEALATLTEIGLLQRVGNGRYRLGWRNISLATVLLRTDGLSAHARPIIRELAQAHGVAASLFAWERGRIICVGRYERGHGRDDRGRAPAGGRPAGSTAPVDDSAPSRVLLAARSDIEVADLWETGRVLTRHATLADMSAELARVRRCGWAYDPPAGSPAALCVAAPVREDAGEAAAALTVVARSASPALDLYRTVKLAVGAAARITAAMRSHALAA